VYCYYSCAQSETNTRIKQIWERFTDYELGHFQFVRELFERIEQRDAAEVIEGALPEALRFESHRDFVRQVIRDEVDLRATGNVFVPASEVPDDSPSIAYRERINAKGSPSELVALGYVWTPGGEISLLRPRTQRNVGRA
jgi:hypothetical protein